ncbi:hypothetical protein CNR22_03765 [Sphingobacteriaceae bacterium]|nr:hypothetical protein CNR22_03765 [Sphingobacteriaceae bacterium]
MNNVEVFKTNVFEISDAKNILRALTRMDSNLIINFDLEDCDKILRIEGVEIDKERIISILINQGFQCEALI